MGQVVQLLQNNTLPTPQNTVDKWMKATDSQRIVAQARMLICQYIIELEAMQCSTSKAFERLQKRYTYNRLQQHLKDAIEQANADGFLPDRATVYRWLKKYRMEGVNGLLANHKGRQVTQEEWHSIAVYEYNQPSKPSMAHVARRLNEEYQMDIKDNVVTRFIKSLPAHLGKYSPKRLGSNERRKTQMNYIRRSSESLEVGMLYQGDGHTIDVYLQHPSTGQIFRPELTVWIDVKSRYIVGWYLSEAESSISTICALSHALIDHDHVPDCLYIDNGSGYKSKMMNSESYGFYSRFGIDAIFATPGNPGAKGQVERFFGVMEKDFGKTFSSAYCGKDAAQRPLQEFVMASKKDNSIVPTVQQWMDGFSNWLDRYHKRPHPEFKNATPEGLWKSLKKNPVFMEEAAVFRPRTERTVSRTTIRLHNREYQNNDLIDYNHKMVHVEYDLHDDSKITVLTAQGQFICYGELVYKKGHLPTSRIEQYKQDRLKGQLKRKQRHIDEDVARSRPPITAENTLIALEELNPNAFVIDATVKQKAIDDVKLNW
jgi:putative transposase